LLDERERALAQFGESGQRNERRAKAVPVDERRVPARLADRLAAPQKARKRT